ncbi:hypothetical protein CMK20_19090 [Candidatus Poribacteria bacterium]|nr:hypothetical protein [Candidatus Poribacteria bacterium]
MFDQFDSLKKHLRSVQTFLQKGLVQWPKKESRQRRKDYLKNDTQLISNVGCQGLSVISGVGYSQSMNGDPIFLQ